MTVEALLTAANASELVACLIALRTVVSEHQKTGAASKAEQQHWSRGQRAGHDYGVLLLQQFLQEKYDYPFNTN